MKFLGKMFIIIVLVVVILIPVRNNIIRIVIEQRVQATTGLRLDIGTLDLDVFKPTVIIKNSKLYNPPGYPDTVMLDIGKIYIHYRPRNIFNKPMLIKEMYFNIRELVFVRQSADQLNLITLKDLIPKSPKPRFIIYHLTLNIGKITYKDYTQPPTPLVKEFNINTKEDYTNVEGGRELTHLILVRALTKTSISQLAQFDLNGLKQSIS
ncbi:MAG: hypothetical protein KBD53_11945, partial [Candidatus Omnitrophica bacterium]|nr:hypothetical protein [Candidatus Omnitrophota bacterium]